MVKKLRWKIAYLVNRSKRSCWADLVSWALDPKDHSLRTSSRRCRFGDDTKRNGACYCGRFGVDGLERSVSQ